MTFYKADSNMKNYLRTLINKFSYENRPNLHNNISITWIRYNSSNPIQKSGYGACWCENKLVYPASIVKLFYGIATEIWIQNDLLNESKELNRALYNMIAHSSNDATSYVVDVLTGTNSGISLEAKAWEIWQKQRTVLNQWLKTFHWPELQNINCSQKTWADSPYGRDKDFYGKNNENRNALCTSSVARMFEALMTNSLLSNKGTKKLKECLLRSLNKESRLKDPENQVDGFLGEGLSNTTSLWSKAGWMSEVRHDAAWWEGKDQNPILTIVFTEGKQLSDDKDLLPSLARELNKFNAESIIS
tara:strand:- start:1795 stop:2703 length:909 start_codon:yes stop_codon:yes gene_type:complete